MWTKWGWMGWVAVILSILILSPLLLLLEVDESEQSATYDLNLDGLMETYHLAHGKLSITQPDSIDWISPPEWDIKSFVLDDVTGDGRAELLMVLWKRGSFGSHKPLWSEQNDNNFSCHLFVYQLINNNLKPRWCSSALDKPIKSLEIKEDVSGKFLAVEEGYFSTYCCGHALFLGKIYSNWTWKQWGFYRLD